MVFVPPLKKLARGAAAAKKLLLECRFEYGKRARRTPQRIQGARVTMSPEGSQTPIRGADWR